MKLLVPLQCRCLGEAFAADVTAVRFGSSVAQAVAKQALGVVKGLAAHLACEELLSCVAEDVGPQKDTPSEGFATVRANMRQWSPGPVLQQLGRRIVTSIGVCRSCAIVRFRFRSFLSSTHNSKGRSTFLCKRRA